MGATGAMMGMSAVSSLATGYEQSKVLKSSGKYQESIANTNAAMADLAGEQTREAGDIMASRKNLETQGRVGEERAVQGASGIDVGSGSAALTRIGTELTGRIDEMTIRNNAARQAWGYKVQGINDRFQGRFARLTGDSQAKQTLLAGGLQSISGPLGIYSNSQSLSRGFKGEGDTPYSKSGFAPQDYSPYKNTNPLRLYP